MIAGKTNDEILSMKNWTRIRWYKAISQEDKEKAMKIVDIVKQAKQSEFMTGESNPAKRPDVRSKISAFHTNRIVFEETKFKMRAAWTPERRRKMSISKMGEKNPSYGGLSKETCAKMSIAHTGNKHSEETISKVSGKNHYNFNNWASRDPYCHLFDEKRKEHIRNLCDRVCVICGKSTFQNISKDGKWLGRLDVDHTDENKMQGCDDWEWRLTALCHSCHGRMVNKQDHLLLELLLFNNKRHQTNFLFGDEYNV